LQAGATSGCLAARQAAAKTAAAQGIGSLAGQAATQNLACINALSTLGGQQQTILQNQQCYPLTKLSNISNLLKGYTVPTSTKQTMCMSPLSGLASVGSTAAGLFGGTGKCGTGQSVFCRIKCSLGFNSSNTNNNVTDNSQVNSALAQANQNMALQNALNSQGTITPSEFAGLDGSAKGGPIRAARGGSIGCASTRHMGGLPTYRR